MKKRGLRRLCEKFGRVARRFELLSLASLSLAFGGCTTTCGMESEKPGRPVTIVELVGTQHDTLPSTPNLESILEKTRATETGRGLLDFAATNKVKITISDSKHMDANPNDAILIRGLNHYTNIELNSEIGTEESMMLTLAHEIRHSWHKRVVKMGELNLDPKRSWISDRIQEADCFAYEIHFGYEYEKATGKSLGLAASQAGYGGLATFYAGLRDSGVAPQDAYRQLVERAFAHTHSLQYDDNFLDKQLKNWSAVVEKPFLGILYAKSWDDPTSAADFVKAMRHVTTVGTDTTKDLSALQSWKDEDFTNLDKTGGAAKDDTEKLAKAEVKFGEARGAWKAHWQKTLDKIKEETRLRNISHGGPVR